MPYHDRSRWTSWFIFLAMISGNAVLLAQELEPLKYRNSDLVVDLGVGLWAWPVPCDADQDGDYDLIVSCPDKPYNGVWLFENRSGDTRIHRFPVFQPARRLSKTVHYVMPSYVVQGNVSEPSSRGQAAALRILSPGFEYRDFMTKGLDDRMALPVAGNFYKPQWKQTKGPKVRHNQWRYADYEGDGDLDLVVGVEDWSEYGWDDAWDSTGKWTNGPLHGFVLLLRNEGSNDVPKYSEPIKVHADGTPIDVFGCPSPNFEDFDQDGDLDLLCGEFLDSFTYFKNTGTRSEPKYAAGQRLKATDGETLRMELEMIVPVAFDWDRDGDVDLVVGDEDGRVALIENVGTTNEMPSFKQPRYFEQVADQLKCGALATPFGVDWDNDGDTDIVSGNTSGKIEFFENLSGPKVEYPLWAKPQAIELQGGKSFRVMAGPNGSIQGPAEAKWGYTTLNVADWDQDGRLDIVFNSILGRVEWMRNLGLKRSDRGRTETVLSEPEPIEVEWPGKSPKPAWTWWQPTGKVLVTQWRTTPVVHDVNQDGLKDLVMLDTEGYLALFRRENRDGKLILLPPERVFCDTKGIALRFNEKLAGGSGRRKLCIVDWDGDGQMDLLLNSANADLYRGLGEKQGRWTFERVGSLAQRNIEGHDVSPTTVDFNGDSIPDFLGGAEDGRFYYLRNPRSKPE